MSSDLIASNVPDLDVQLVRLTVEQFYRLTETGILEEGQHIELLDGLVLWVDRRDVPSERPDSQPGFGDGPETIATRLFLEEGPELVRFDVDQYARMTEEGILPEGSPIELLDGVLVWKDRRDSPDQDIMNVGSKHATTVTRLYRFFDRHLEHTGFHVRSQQPVELPSGQCPEPDVSLVHGAVESFEQVHPRSSDVPVVIEVSGTTLRSDRRLKQRIYADAGIPTYLLVDLAASRIVAYTNPQVGTGRYADSVSFASGDRVVLTLAPDVTVEVPVAEVL